MFNYESLGITDLYERKMGVKEIRDEAIERLKEAWTDGEVITFQRATGSHIYVMGVENRKDNGEWFVKIEKDGFPEEIIGGVFDLIEYMESHYADYFELLEVE